jgi:hypothetical protein
MQGDSNYSLVLDSPQTSPKIPTALGGFVPEIASQLKGRTRISTLNVLNQEGHSQVSWRAISQPTNVLQCALTQIPSLNNITDGPEEGRIFNFGVASKKIVQAPSLKVTSKNSKPSPEPRLYHSQIEGTILFTRLKDHKIFRKVGLTNARSVDDLFKECAQRWPDKFGAGGIARLLYVDEESHLVEIVDGNSDDYKEFLRMVQRRWDDGGGEMVGVKVILLAAGEDEEIRSFH